MTPRPPLRIFLDLVAACLLVAGLAYWWLGNTAHELIGAGLFVLAIAHNGFHRRWYGRIGRSARQPRGRLLIAVNLGFGLAMSALLGSSLIVSRSLFGFLPFEAGATARTVHLLAAYWAMVLVGLHVGLNWPLVSAALRPRLAGRLPPPTGMVLAWALAAGIVAHGLAAVFTMDLGAKLLNRPTLDMWDFTTRTPLFFVNWLSIIGLFAVLGHLLALAAARRTKRNTKGTPADTAPNHP